MNPFEYIKQRITDIADVNVAINGRDPSWGYSDLMELLANIEEAYNDRYGSSDVVYRSDAIEACHKDYDSILDFRSNGWTVASSFEEILNALPPAQPEHECGYTGIEEDYPVSIKAVLDITAETGALTTQERVRELPKYRKLDNDWIPVEEKMPEDFDSVLISHSKGVTKAWWNGRVWCNGMTKRFKTVLAWMPLPTQYRKGNKNG